MFGIKEANEYMAKMGSVVGRHLNDPDSIYYGKDGHLRLARECGYALNDFDETGQREILSGSYEMVYVTGCVLKPILDAKEWVEEMKKEKRGGYYEQKNKKYRS